MARLTLIDSNVYIELLRQRRDPIAVLTERMNLHDICSCGIVLGEVMRGIRGRRTREQLLRFFSLSIMLPTPALLWDEVWQLAWQMDRKGIVIPLTDTIIAACALRADAAVLTYDKHFQSVPGLEVIEP